MSHILKYSEWQSPSGVWYCNDTSDLAGLSSKWWIPARMLGISLTDYILLLKDEFNATIVKYNSDTDILIYHWKNYADCHRFLLWINRMSKKANFII